MNGMMDPKIQCRHNEADKSLPLSGLLVLSQRVNRRTLRVYSFHSGLARWSLLRYTVPIKAPIDIFFFVIMLIDGFIRLD